MTLPPRISGSWRVCWFFWPCLAHKHLRPFDSSESFMIVPSPTAMSPGMSPKTNTGATGSTMSPKSPQIEKFPAPQWTSFRYILKCLIIFGVFRCLFFCFGTRPAFMEFQFRLLHASAWSFQAGIARALNMAASTFTSTLGLRTVASVVLMLEQSGFGGAAISVVEPLGAELVWEMNGNDGNRVRSTQESETLVVRCCFDAGVPFTWQQETTRELTTYEYERIWVGNGLTSLQGGEFEAAVATSHIGKTAPSRCRLGRRQRQWGREEKSWDMDLSSTYIRAWPKANFELRIVESVSVHGFTILYIL